MHLNALVLSAIAAAPLPPPPHAAPARPVDLAICLDTSGSMQGLIESAKQKLWAVVNELATAKPTPRLRVALLTYGNNGHGAEDGWVRIDVPFTDDLDRVSQQLFALSTNGGEEYVGRVLDRARMLDWTPSDDALKLAVVAGNESADQDRVISFRDACRSMIARGVMVNSFYCGSETDGDAPLWREVALLADGRFACIDHDRGTVIVETPFDIDLSSLSSALNATYIPIGSAGGLGAQNQVLQDGNASMASAAAGAARAQTKANAMYNCSWDLVDALRNGQCKIGDVETADLPENMRAMSVQERSAWVDETYRRRCGIQAQINDLAAKRQSFIDARMKEQGLDESKSFDLALRQAVREQAAKKGFTF
jgi:hypothetical protein